MLTELERSQAFFQGGFIPDVILCASFDCSARARESLADSSLARRPVGAPQDGLPLPLSGSH